MKRKQFKKSPVFQGRRLFLMLGLLGALSILLIRAVWLEVFQQEWLQQQADKVQLAKVPIPAYRGMILDRNGDPMAVSSPVESLWCNPQKFLQAREAMRHDYELNKSPAPTTTASNTPTTPSPATTEAAATNAVKYARLEKDLGLIAGELETTADELLERIQKAALDKQFYYIGRQLPPEVVKDLVDLDIPGVGSTREYRRYYPLGETAAQVVGMVNVDGLGIDGIEKASESVLAGKQGYIRGLRDAKGRMVESVEQLEEMQPGQDVQLTIDRRIQYLAYKELKGRVFDLKAKAGAMVVLDAHTGEILAMVNVPSFNPNNRKEIEPNLLRNRTVTDRSEPGSTLKPLTLAAALQARAIGPDIEINTSPGKINFGDYVVKDPKDYGTISLPTLLAKSSNVGASRVALLMEPRDHYMFLRSVGFGQVPNTGFANETSGLLTNYTTWGKVDRASHGYGYGLSTSLLQLAHAYTPFAAGGLLLPATIYKVVNPVAGQQVMSPANAKAVVRMMEAVVQKGGTGEKAMIDGYRVAGKTGTAFKFVNKTYRTDKYLTSFIGIAPASNPRLVVAIQIDEPQIDDSGGRAAAPVFSRVMGEALRLLDIPPDNLPSARRRPAPVAPATPVPQAPAAVAVPTQGAKP